MATEQPVKLSVRLTDTNRARLKLNEVRLQLAVSFGRITSEDALAEYSQLVQQLTEYRIEDGEWRPLAEAEA